MKTFQKILLFASFALLCQLLGAASWAGEVIGWGYNYGGQATGNTTNGSPGLVTLGGQPLADVVAISAGQDHCLALKGDGTVVGWGYDESGAATRVKGQETGNGLVMIDGQVLSNVTAVSASTFSMALKKDGTIVVWGDEGKFSPPAGLSNIMAISAGFNQGFALKSDSTAVGWGMTRSPVGLTNITAIATSDTWGGNNMALKRDGTVLEWDNRNGSPIAFAGVSNVVAIAAGTKHSLMLKRDGIVMGVGPHSGGFGEAIIPIGLSNVVAIAAGDEFSLALKKDGRIVLWGKSPYHRMDVPDGLSNVVAIAAGENFCLAITTNRAVADKFRH
jgi:alpha-tubulin suppressor-like RCC1 family protein